MKATILALALLVASTCATALAADSDNLDDRLESSRP